MAGVKSPVNILPKEAMYLGHLPKLQFSVMGEMCLSPAVGPRHFQWQVYVGCDTTEGPSCNALLLEDPQAHSPTTGKLDLGTKPAPSWRSVVSSQVGRYGKSLSRSVLETLVAFPPESLTDCRIEGRRPQRLLSHQEYTEAPFRARLLETRKC